VTRQAAHSPARRDGANVREPPAAAHFGWLVRFFALDAPASSARTQEQLGWRPRQPGLLSDMDQGRYFEVAEIAAHIGVE
jgi:hypothetical protein